jgi:dipeptidase E
MAWKAIHGRAVLYLTYWLRQSGLAGLLPSLSDTVYVGVSAGSIAVTPYTGIPVPTYAIDDNTAIKVVDGTAEVISEGDWRLINP